MGQLARFSQYLCYLRPQHSRSYCSMQAHRTGRRSEHADHSGRAPDET